MDEEEEQQNFLQNGIQPQKYFIKALMSQTICQILWILSYNGIILKNKKVFNSRLFFVNVFRIALQILLCNTTGMQR